MASVDVADVMARAMARKGVNHSGHESSGEQPSTTVEDGDGIISMKTFPLPPPKGVGDVPLGLVTASQIQGLSKAQQDHLFQYVRSRIQDGSINIDYVAAQDIREQFSRCGVEFLPTPYEIYTEAGDKAANAHVTRINSTDQPMAHWRAQLTYWLFAFSRGPGNQHYAFGYRVMETVYLVAYFFELF